MQLVTYISYYLTLNVSEDTLVLTCIHEEGVINVAAEELH